MQLLLGKTILSGPPEDLPTFRVTRRGPPDDLEGASNMGSVQVALFTDSSVSFRPNFDKFLKISVLAGSAKQFPASFFHDFLTV